MVFLKTRFLTRVSASQATYRTSQLFSPMHIHETSSLSHHDSVRCSNPSQDRLHWAVQLINQPGNSPASVNIKVNSYECELLTTDIPTCIHSFQAGIFYIVDFISLFIFLTTFYFHSSKCFTQHLYFSSSYIFKPGLLLQFGFVGLFGGLINWLVFLVIAHLFSFPGYHA